ncbi:MAG TPA: PAS domain-containing protein [Labilithrix sp.]|nr:PAS domain-containing protein [Labilithrix sp.]
MATHSRGAHAHKAERETRRERGSFDGVRNGARDAGWWDESETLVSVLSGAGLGYWAHDVESGHLECSESCKVHLGLPADAELSTYPQFTARVHPEDRPKIEEVRELALAGKAECQVEFRVVTPPGEIRWVAARAGVHRRPAGGAVMAGIMVDITSYKVVEDERERLIVELAAERARLRAIVDQMPAAVLVGEAPTGRIILKNAAVARIFPTLHASTPVESADLFRSWHALHADGRPVEPHERPLSRALGGDTVTGEDFRYIHQDGSDAWIRLSSAPVRDDAGTVIGAVVIGTDVDREKRAEEALRAGESRMRQLFESPVIGILHAKVNGALLSANDRFLRMVGYSREDLEAGLLDWRAMTPSEYREIDDAMVEELVRTGAHRVYEKDYVRKDGTRVPIALGGTLFDGDRSEVVTFVLDISDRKKADVERESLLESLARSEERYRLAAMATEDVIYDWDLRADRVSVHTIFGHGRAAISNSRSWVDLIHPTDRERVVAGLHAAIANGEQHWQAEYRFWKADGTWVNVMDRAHVARDGAGRPVRMVGAMQDVTARRRQEEFERQLIGIVSHDLKNPLQTIVLAAEMLSRSEEIGPQPLKNIARIQAAAQRAARMIRDLLDFTRARLGAGIPIERRSVALGNICQGLLEEARAQHSDRTIHFEAAGELTGAFDADRLGQVVTNLVENALKYSPPGSPVRVTLRGEAEEVVLAVHNGGPPIPPDLRTRIFEPMQRGETVIDSTGRSVGLGLYIVKHLVEAHGGRVEVRSSPEEGTVFDVRLPRTEVAA